jgi:hypothetical protein
MALVMSSRPAVVANASLKIERHDAQQALRRSSKRKLFITPLLRINATVSREVQR